MTAEIYNTDNHLRNHGFLREGAGWTLAPAFDINPNPEVGDFRATAVMGSALPRNTGKGLLEFARTCGLKEKRAIEVLDEVATVVETWRDVAESNGATAKLIAKFTDAFTITTDNVRGVLPSKTRARTAQDHAPDTQP